MSGVRGGGMFICPASDGLVLKSSWTFLKGGGLEWNNGSDFLDQGILWPILIRIRQQNGGGRRGNVCEISGTHKLLEDIA